MDKNTGQLIDGIQYLRQRFTDALSTAQYELVADRLYGAKLDDLIDENITDVFRMRVFSRVAHAIRNPINGLDDIALRELSLEEHPDNTVSIIATVDWRQAETTQPLALQSLLKLEAA